MWLERCVRNDFFLFQGQDVDDDELERELEELEQEELDKELIGVKPVPTDKLPDVPSAEPATSKEKKKGKFHLAEAKQNMMLKSIWFFSVPAKPAAEDDEDMKLLMSWGN